MKTVLVTGGNKGIGLAVCRGLAEKGFRVFLGSRDAKRGKQACEELHRAGYANVEMLLIDISKVKSIASAVEKLEGMADHLDVLVNNAGIHIDNNADVLTVDPKVILDTFGTNTMGPLLVTRAMTPLLAKAANGAQVVNVSSSMGQLDDMNSGSAAYRISKTALNAVTRILSHELADRNIHVNSVCPGWVKTDMGGTSAPRGTKQGAETIVWLATGQAGMQSGKFFRDQKPIAW